MAARRKNRKGVAYFLVTAFCFTIVPTVQKMSVQESSVLFASFLVHLLIGFGFLGLIISLKETSRFSGVLFDPKLRKLLGMIMLAGAIIAIENGSINAALANAPVAYVMALKRLMPLFAFVIGLLYFKERTEMKRKMIATAFMVLGAVMITVFK